MAMENANISDKHAYMAL